MTSASLATNCKPVLGFSSKGAACIALKAEGYTWTQVAKLVGMRDGRAASSLVHRTRKRAEASVRTLELGGNVFLDLEREARRRNRSANQLALDILHRVILDKLYAAVLDE